MEIEIYRLEKNVGRDEDYNFLHDDFVVCMTKPLGATTGCRA